MLWPALLGNPFEAISGLYWFVTRRRVRGWSALVGAAAQGPNSYATWISAAEERAFNRFRQAHAHRRDAQIVPLLVVNQPACTASILRSLASIRAGLGEDVRIYSTSPTSIDCIPLPTMNGGGAAAALSCLARAEQPVWLVPVLAGDLVSPLLGDVLGQAIESNAGAELFYWDEDRIGAQGRSDPWVKPDWDELLFDQLGGLAGASAILLAAAAGDAESKPH